MVNHWGNPELKSFKNNHIRRVIVDNARVFVHRNLTAEVEEILLRAAGNGAVFSKDGLPAILPAFEMDDSIEAKYGLKFQIPNFDVELELEDTKFTQIGDVFIYEDFSEKEEESSSTIESVYIDKVQDKLGSRQLKLGSQGDDVKFISYFLGISEAAIQDKYDETLRDGILHFQTRMGITQTGEVDWNTWKAIMPRATDRIAAGYAGVKVRALQSALRIFGYNCPVTSRFGTETIRSVREFQTDRQLRITGRVGYLEWKELFELK
jgi:peptidoglycan hydrolase-like protein with peptidoglycan-binding domain